MDYTWTDWVIAGWMLLVAGFWLPLIAHELAAIRRLMAASATTESPARSPR
jgi:hypothetical protein